MINSICYEIRYSPNGLKLLRDLFGLRIFPHALTRRWSLGKNPRTAFERVL